MLLGVETQLLGPTALLHHLAVHASSDTIARRVRLLYLNDIALVARAVDEHGWQQILTWAGEPRLIYPALAFTSRYYPGVPPGVLHELRSRMPPALLSHLDESALDRFSFCNTAPTSLGDRLLWFRPGRERASALRHMLLPDAGEIATWYPRLARPALLPLAYARYSAEMIGWGVRRILGQPRLKLAHGQERRPAHSETEELGAEEQLGA
jgi:hypothetical protein